MQKVIIINLNGIAYQLDEAAYDTLRAYLGRAEDVLADNPDRAEIVADLEQAIADKCNKLLGPQKSVVTAPEMAQILKEMGPVDVSAAESGGAGEQSRRGPDKDKGRAENDAPRRLYLLREGSMISGVCNGLAAFLGIDVTIVRVVFVVLAVLTKGVGILLYAVLMFVVPYANTSEERAAARGRPFNAREVMGHAQPNEAEFISSKQFKRHWTDQQRAWRRELRKTVRERRWWGPIPPISPPAVATAAAPIGYSTQLWAGFLTPILGIASAAFFVLFMVALVSFGTTGTLMGWPFPSDIPSWAGFLIIVALYNVLAWPIHMARQASHHVLQRHNFGWFVFWDGLLGLGFTIFFVWLAFQYVPEVRDFVHNLPPGIQRLVTQFVD